MSEHTPLAGPALRIGDWTVDARLNELRRGGRAVRVEPKAVEVLMHLARNAGNVVSRDELLAALWPGVIVGDDTLTQAIIKLRKALEDDAYNPRYIETISKRGYRLVAPVSHIAAAATGAPGAGMQPVKPPARRRAAIAAGAGIAFLAAAAFLVARMVGNAPMPWPLAQDTRGAPTAPLPTVAVMPLANLSGDAGRDYFSDGFTEDIIGALGRFSGLRVFSRAAVQPFKGRNATPRQLRTELGARYIVQGSVREAAGRVRVSVELGDAQTGTQLWAERYEGEGKDVFEIQDRIVRSVAGALAVKVTNLELQRAASRPVENLEAHDLVLRARELLHDLEREKNRQARVMLTRAIELAPRHAEAYAALAYAEFMRADFGWVQDIEAAMARSEAYAHQALAIDDPGAQARAHAQLAKNYSMLNRYDEALAQADRAIALNPSDTVALHARGATLVWLGRPEEGVATIQAAQRFGGSGTFTFDLANAAYIMGRYREALSHAEAGLSRTPDSIPLNTMRAAALGQLDDPGCAAAAAQVRRLSPFFRPELIGTRFRNPDHRARYQEGLRKAGL